MDKTIESYQGNRDNNFNLMRFIAALLVLYSHAYALYGIAGLEPLSNLVGMTFGALAVDLFFVTSGFLIAGSFYGGKSLKAFTKARLLRIFPALIVAVLITVFVLGLYFTTRSAIEYFTDPLTSKYLVRNSILIFNVKFFLPGVFENVPYPNTVNGSLWTLPYEIKCYAALVAVGCLLPVLQRKLNTGCLKVIYLFIACSLVIASIINHYVDFSSSESYRLFAMFFSGASLYVWRKKIILSHSIFLVLLGLFLSSFFYQAIFYPVYYITVIYSSMYLAYIPNGVIRNFNKIGDYSYGIYIYAFPIQQGIICMFPNIGFNAYVGSASIITITLAVLSWHGLEKKCLKFRFKSAT